MNRTYRKSQVPAITIIPHNQSTTANKLQSRRKKPNMSVLDGCSSAISNGAVATMSSEIIGENSSSGPIGDAIGSSNGCELPACIATRRGCGIQWIAQGMRANNKPCRITALQARRCKRGDRQLVNFNSKHTTIAVAVKNAVVRSKLATSVVQNSLMIYLATRNHGSCEPPPRRSIA